MTNNAKMKYYLSKKVFPLLIEKGFTGKYPHFRRICSNYIELISIQTNKWGGSFTIEVSAVFPNSIRKNYSDSSCKTEKEELTVWNTNERYRLKGMYKGWFYYRDLYVKYIDGFGKTYLDVNEKQSADFVVPEGYKLVQKFNDTTAAEICDEINKQLDDAFEWLRKFENKRLLVRLFRHHYK